MSPRSRGCGHLRSGLVKGMARRVTAANFGVWLCWRSALLVLTWWVAFSASAAMAAIPGRWLAPEVQRTTFRPVNGVLAQRQSVWPRRVTDSTLGAWYQPVARFRPDIPAAPGAAEPRSGTGSAEADAHAQFRPFARPHIGDSGEVSGTQSAWFGPYPLYAASPYTPVSWGWPVMMPFPPIPLPFWGVSYGTVTPNVPPPLAPYTPWPYVPPYWPYR